MIPNLIEISQKIIIRARIKIVLKKYENDFELFSFSVLNSNFIIELYAEGT